MTTGRQFQPYKQGHHFVATLQVQEVFATHEIGGLSYLQENLSHSSSALAELGLSKALWTNYEHKNN